MAQQISNKQLAFGFVAAVAAEEKRPTGPAQLAEVGVSGYQDLYRRLLEQGWRWQKAAFMAWRAAPRGSRAPQTQNDLARLLGYTGDKIFRVWLEKPDQGPLMEKIISDAAKLVFEAHLADVDLVTITQAKAPNSGIGQRELFYKRYYLLTGKSGGDTGEVDRLTGMDIDEIKAELARLEQIQKDTP